MKKSLRKIPGRVHRFRGYFGPIIDLRLLPLQFVQLQMKHGITSFPASHVVKLFLSELPQDSKKPKLRLDGIQTLELFEIEEKYRQHLEHGIRSYSDSFK